MAYPPPSGVTTGIGFLNSSILDINNTMGKGDHSQRKEKKKPKKDKPVKKK
jgi:hypothetical protein